MSNTIETEGWRSKLRWRGKAHYVLADGSTACADTLGPWGVPMKDLMKCGWQPLRPDDHLCGFCVRKHPRTCECLSCRVKAFSTPVSKEKP